MKISNKMVESLDQAIERMVQDGRKYLDDGELAVAAITLKDAADLQSVSSYLREGRVDIAVRWIEGLDTTARESIPATLYSAIMTHA